MRFALKLALAAAISLLPVAAAAQQADPAVAAERHAAMERLGFLHGVWVGPASGMNPDGTRYAVTQTERMGPMLGGDILVIEGRGYEEDGSTGFNAFAVISYDANGDKYEIRSYAQGYAGTFPLTPTDDGFVWEVPAGPGVMRFTATVAGDHYREVGVFVMPGQPERPSFEMNLIRRGDTDWPAAGAVDPTP